MMQHKCIVFGVTYTTPHEKMLAMVYALHRAIDTMSRDHDSLPDGIVVPRVGECIAAVWAASSSFVKGSLGGFTLYGVPILFGGSDPTVAPFGVSRLGQ